MSQGSDLGPNPMGKKNVKGKTSAEVQMCRLCQEGGLLGKFTNAQGPPVAQILQQQTTFSTHRLTVNLCLLLFNDFV